MDFDKETIRVTPDKNSLSKTLSNVLFSRSNMKEKVRLLSRVFSTKKKRSWKPSLYSPDIFKDEDVHGSYDKKNSPVGIPTPLDNSELKTQCSKMQKRNAVINLVRKFDLLATAEPLRTEKGDDSSDLGTVLNLESSPVVQTCVIDMVQNDSCKPLNPFLPQESVIQVTQCNRRVKISGCCVKNVKPPITPKSSLFCDTVIFKNLDKRALEVSHQCYTDTKQLVEDLTVECQSELETARVIFRWVIAMDQKKAQMHDFLPSDVLGSRKESCQKLFANLCRQAGLHCEIIVGYSKGAGYKPGMRIDHKTNRNSWTAVSIDGNWRFVNCTWAARHLTGGQTELSSLLHKLDEFYFLTDPQQHIYQHYPDEQTWQLLEIPITLDDFKRLPALKSPFFKHGLKFTKESSSLVVADCGLVEVSLRMPLVLQFGTKLESADSDQDQLENCILTRTVGDEVKFLIRLPHRGSFVFSTFAGTPDTMGYLECIFTLGITCEGSNEIASFPPVPMLGPTEAVLKSGLSCLSHLDPYIQMDGNSLRLDFATRDDMKYAHTLQYYDTKASSFIDIDRYSFPTNRTDDRLTYSVACPRRGSYLFSVFGGSLESRNYDCQYQFLLVCKSDDLSRLAFPRSSRGWKNCKLRTPICGDLVLESSYFFDLTVPNAENIFVCIGEEKQPLCRSRGDNWTGQVYTGGEFTEAVIFATFANDSDPCHSKSVRLLTYNLL